jgi:hypothetical protein
MMKIKLKGWRGDWSQTEGAERCWHKGQLSIAAKTLGPLCTLPRGLLWKGQWQLRPWICLFLFCLTHFGTFE